MDANVGKMSRLEEKEVCRNRIRSNEVVAHLIDWTVLAVLNIHFSRGRT